MGWISDSVRTLYWTMRSAFRKPVTVQFPQEIRPRPERYRTSFALLHDEGGDELCIGCLQCERICPSRVIKIDQAPKRESPVTGKKRGYASDFTLDLEACIFCELCVQVCPTDAIIMTRTAERPGFSREDLVLTMDKLYANEKGRPASWATGTKLMEMQDPKRGEEKKAKPEKAAKAEKPAPEAKVEAKPAEAKPAEAKPAEARPADPKPAESGTGTGTGTGTEKGAPT
jgi:NADH-quinone oxidoreductase subunit I